MHNAHIQIAADGGTVWVHADDGPTVGRFSKRFGMDVHTPVTERLKGASQCLHCTHTPSGSDQWLEFVRLMASDHKIKVPFDLVRF